MYNNYFTFGQQNSSDKNTNSHFGSDHFNANSFFPHIQSHSSDQLLYQKRRAGAGPTLRWPTPSLLVVPPSLRRPKTVEVLQQATEQLKAAAGEKGEEMGEEEKNDAGQREEKKKSTGSNELV
jgi:hypothetical protein